MKNGIETSLAIEEMMATEQAMLRVDDMVGQDLDVDAKLSNSIYRFLTGKTTEVLSADSINKIYEKRENSIISMACGLIVDDNFKITYDEPVSPKTSRITKISEDSYIAYYTNEKRGIKEINLEEKPIFDKSRVEVIQRYMKYVKDYVKENSKNK